MNKQLFCLVIAMMGTCLSAQNLAPNPSFETTSGCPPGNSGISSGYAPPWNRPPGSITTPDLFHSCGSVGLACSNINVPGNNYGGTSAAFDGVAYAGILTYYTACTNCREYIHAPLTSTMTAGVSYEVRMRVKLSPLSRYATNRFGIHLSNTAPTQPSNQPILLTPSWQYPGVLSDKVNWVLLRFDYVAAGGEGYITVGNFYNNASTTITDFGSSAGSCALVTSGNIYYIDSIFVGATILSDPSITLSVQDDAGVAQLDWNLPDAPQGSRFVLERAKGGQAWHELVSDVPAQSAATHRHADEHPLSGRSYYRVRCLLPDGSEATSPTVEFVSLRNDRTAFSLEVFPNPADDQLTVSLFPDGPEPQQVLLRMIGMDGKLVIEREIGLETVLDVSGIAPGIYAIQVEADGMTRTERVMIH